MSVKKAIEDIYIIDNVYEYGEVVGDDPNVRFFGWLHADRGEFNYEQPLVLSYHSNTKFATEEEREWSKEERYNLASLDDYRSYFVSLTGEHPEEFLDNWQHSDEELKAYWESKYPNSDDNFQHLFVKSIANLIVNRQKFIMYSRAYIVIELENPDDGGRAP